MLCKYGKDDQYFRENLRNSRIWFSTPSKFNDLNDCALSFERLDDDDIRGHLASNLEALTATERVLHSRLANATEAAEVAEINGLLEALKEAADVLQQAGEQALADRGPEGLPDHSGKLLKSIQDAFTFRRGSVAHPANAKLSDSIGISCFSDDCDNHNLWGVYGDNHQGVCIAVEPSHDPKCFQELRAVRYEATLPRLKAPLLEEQLIKFYSTKSARFWSHEREIRAFQHEAGSYEMNRQCLVGVFFGTRASPETVRDITEIVDSKYGLHVPLFRMHVDSNLKLRPEPLMERMLMRVSHRLREK